MAAMAAIHPKKPDPLMECLALVSALGYQGKIDAETQGRLFGKLTELRRLTKSDKGDGEK